MFWVAGIDEAGRGPLAGPVTAACVCLPPRFSCDGVSDSKKLTATEREELEPIIRTAALAFAIVSVGHHRIDALNIREATRRAMLLAARRVHDELSQRFGDGRMVLLIDGNMKIETNHHQEPIVKGDDRIMSISAASILAKVTRDRIMCTLAKKYEGYGFENHKGYGTAEHRQEIAGRGPCRVHRRSFGGVREHLPGFWLIPP